jgi:hypothetical protein
MAVARVSIPLLFVMVLTVGCHDDPEPHSPAVDAGRDDIGATDAGVDGGDHVVPDAAVDGGDDGTDLEGDIADWLGRQQGIEAHEVPTDRPGYRRFDITFEQPADHAAPDGLKFKQRIILHHTDESAPMVLATTGYDLPPADYEYVMEPTELLSANQLMVEHRFFPPSIPEPADWTKLDIQQSATDFHRIVERFARRYRARWLNTGASKGGMTAVFHRRFYPDDVDGTIGYVTPITLGLVDQRYQTFLDAIDVDGCAQAVRDLARRFVVERAHYGELLRGELGHADKFTTPESAEVFAISVAQSFEWGFWQYRGVSECPGVSDALSDDATTSDAAASELLEYEVRLSEYTSGLWAYYYQAMNELGYPGTSTPYLDDVLAGVMFPDTPSEPPPWGNYYPPFEAAAMQDVSGWLAGESSAMLFVYGQYDPWTAGKVDLGSSEDTLELIAPDGNHGSEIAQLAPADRELALDALYRWADVERPAGEKSRKRVHGGELPWRSLPPPRLKPF